MSDHPLKFRFNPKKAAQAANKILRLSGGQRNYMELVKLLYLADRESLVRLESQITGDRLVALKYGTVLSHVLDLIKTGPTNEEDAPWFESVSAPCGYDVKAIGNPGEDELSGAESQVIDDVFQKYGGMDWKQLSRFTHTLPEWVDPNGSAVPISPEQILILSGIPKDRIEQIKKEAAFQRKIDAELLMYDDGVMA